MLQTLKNRRAQAGFTLVELLIVIVVIAILAAIVINTFSGVQARARDTERQTDIKSIAAQLEVYHTNNGKYPTATQMQAAASTIAGGSGILKGLSPDALKDPQGVAADDNHFTNAAPTAVGTYGYVTVPATCDNTTGNECTAFTVSYWSESATPAAAKSTTSLN